MENTRKTQFFKGMSLSFTDDRNENEHEFVVVDDDVATTNSDDSTKKRWLKRIGQNF